MELEVLQKWQTTHFKAYLKMNNGMIRLHDLVEIDGSGINSPQVAPRCLNWLQTEPYSPKVAPSWPY